MKTRLWAVLVLSGFLAGAVAWAAEEVEEVELGENVTCPVSGKAVDPTSFVEFNGGKVYFCCTNCPKAFEKDSAKFTTKANHQLVLTGQLKQSACPITGKPTKETQTVDVQGVTVALCCGNCKAKLAGLAGDEQLDLAFGAENKGFKAEDAEGDDAS